MSTLNYFKLKEKLKTIDDQLPNPDGPLNKEVGILCLTIVSTNALVHSMIASGSSRGLYVSPFDSSPEVPNWKES